MEHTDNYFSAQIVTIKPSHRTLLKAKKELILFNLLLNF
jgi:hypothetical protein